MAFISSYFYSVRNCEFQKRRSVFNKQEEIMDTAHFEKLNRIRLVPVLLKARTEIPPLVTEVSLSFMASLCTPVHEEN
jgi:hypothetical protein